MVINVNKNVLRASLNRYYFEVVHVIFSDPTRVCSVEEIYTCYQHNIGNKRFNTNFLN